MNHASETSDQIAVRCGTALEGLKAGGVHLSKLDTQPRTCPGADETLVDQDFGGGSAEGVCACVGGVRFVL